MVAYNLGRRDKMNERLEALRKEQADLIRTVFRHLDPVFAQSEALLRRGSESQEENLQISQHLSSLESYINACADARRLLQQKFETLEQGLTQEDSPEAPPPSYNEVVFSYRQRSDENHSNSPAFFDASRICPFSCKAEFKPIRRLPDGTHLSPREKNRPIAEYFGSWNFTSDGGWTLHNGFNCFQAPVDGLYNVKIEWRQQGNGVLEVGLGMLDESSLENLYCKEHEAITSSDLQLGCMTKTLNLHKKQGVWISLLRIGVGKYPHVENLIFHAFRDYGEDMH